MWRISVIDSDGRELGGYDIDETVGSISVGRGADNHIYIDGEGVGRQHAYFYVSEGEVVLEDAGSPGGTLVDGYPIDGPVFVAPGSQIEIGPYFAEVFVLDGTAAPGPAPAAGGMDAQYQDYYDAPADGEYSDAGAGEVRSVAVPSVAVAQDMMQQQGPLKLVALSGLRAGDEIELGKFTEDFDVGRDKEMEIPLLDPTISRRHARLRKTDAGLMVIDLRSTNGTFINGEKVKRQEALPGDRIRFGDVAFQVKERTAPGAGASIGGIKFSRRHMILAGAGGILLLFIIVLGVLGGQEKPRRRGGGGGMESKEDPSERLARRFRGFLAQAQAHMDKRDWEKAMRALEKSKDIFTKHKRRDNLVARVRREMHNRETLQKANEIFTNMANTMENLRRALGLFEEIKDGAYANEASISKSKVVRRLFPILSVEGMKFSKSYYTKRLVVSQEYLCEFFRILPRTAAVRNEDKVRKRLVAVEAKLKKRQKEAFKPCKSRRFLAPPGSYSQAGVDALGKLREKFKEEKILQAMNVYFSGSAQEAFNRMRALLKDRRLRGQRLQIQRYMDILNEINSNFQEGQGALARDDLGKAKEAFGKVLQKDQELLPPGLKSHLRTEVARVMGARYLKKGQVQFDNKRYVDAFFFWKEGKRWNGSDPDILNALYKLRKVASQWIGRAASFVNAGKKDEARQWYEKVKKIVEGDAPQWAEANKGLQGL